MPQEDKRQIDNQQNLPQKCPQWTKVTNESELKDSLKRDYLETRWNQIKELRVQHLRTRSNHKRNWSENTHEHVVDLLVWFCHTYHIQYFSEFQSVVELWFLLAGLYTGWYRLVMFVDTCFPDTSTHCLNLVSCLVLHKLKRCVENKGLQELYRISA